jgi:broad specificity phosphatase PhoE
MSASASASQDIRVTRLLLARHPETEANVAKRFVGRGDTPYTALGRSQVTALSAAIVAFSPDVVLTSPRMRAVNVAAPAADLADARLQVVDELAEIDFGQAEGLTYNEASELGISMDLLGGPGEDRPFEGGETWSRFDRRVRRAWGIATGDGDRVAVVTHSGVLRCMLTIALELPADAAWRFAIAPASVTLLTAGADFAVLEIFGLPPERAAEVV